MERDEVMSEFQSIYRRLDDLNDELLTLQPQVAIHDPEWEGVVMDVGEFVDEARARLEMIRGVKEADDD